MISNINQKFSNWVDQFKKPPYRHPLMISDEWVDKVNEYEVNHPVANFLFYSIPDMVSDMVSELKWSIIEPFSGPIHKFFCRYIFKDWRLDIGVNRWQEHNTPTQILYSNFSLLAKFVEFECARKATWMYSSKKKRLNYKSRLLQQIRGKRWRSEEAGLLYLRDQMEFDDPTKDDLHPKQAAEARVIYELYSWWKHKRPTRLDIWDASGYTTLNKHFTQKYGETWSSEISWGSTDSDIFSNEDAQKYTQVMNALDAVELEYQREDEEMLTKLISVIATLTT